MIRDFETRPIRVKALQLSRDTLQETLIWTNGFELTPDRWIASEHCWRVSALRFYPVIPGAPYFLHAAGTLIIGLRTKQGEEVAYDGDWIVQPSGTGGGFEVVAADRFGESYVPAREAAHA